MAQAFAMLRNHARSHNLRLTDLASDVIGGATAVADLDRRGHRSPPDSIDPPAQPAQRGCLGVAHRRVWGADLGR